MKSKSLIILSSLVLSLFPKAGFGQLPDLGAASGFGIFTSSGAFTNNGSSSITGDIGTNAGALTGFPPGTYSGQIHVADAVSSQAATDLSLAYSDLSTRTTTSTIAVTLGGGQVLTPGVYSTGAASTLNGILTLDALGDPDALFIFQIDGTLSTTTASSVLLINNASLCNVFWQTTGAISLGANSIFRGNIVSGGAIELLDGASLHGRGLTTAGEIILNTNTVSPLPSAAGAITGTASICQGSDGITYTVPEITDATGYVWSLPAGATISSGTNTNSITVDFSNTASSGNITVYGTNACGGNGAVSPNFLVTVNALPDTSLIYHL